MGPRSSVDFLELRPSDFNRTTADLEGGPQFSCCGGPLSGDGRVLPEGAADAARWRDVAINRFGNYIRIRRMDGAELLWAADPGDPYPFMPGSGHGYQYGDYGKLLAKTAGVEEQLRFKELPNFRSPHTAALAPADLSPQAAFNPHYSRGQFFTVNFVRNGSDHVSPGKGLYRGLSGRFRPICCG